MNRTKLIGLPLALVAMMPATASALGISVVNVTTSSGSTSLIEDGATVTVDLVVENATNEAVYGLGFGIAGFDTDQNGLQDDGLTFSSAQVSDSILNSVVVGGTPFLGLDNVRTSPVLHGNHNPIFPSFNEEVKVTLFEGVNTTPANGDGTLDLGVGGTPVGAGDVHVRVQFLATGGTAGLLATTTTLQFGIFEDVGHAAVGLGGSPLAFDNASLSLRIVPEPGTGLLMGLGLAGLATTRRR